MTKRLTAHVFYCSDNFCEGPCHFQLFKEPLIITLLLLFLFFLFSSILDSNKKSRKSIVVCPEEEKKRMLAFQIQNVKCKKILCLYIDKSIFVIHLKNKGFRILSQSYKRNLVLKSLWQYDLRWSNAPSSNLRLV